LKTKTLADWVKFFYNDDPYSLPSDELRQAVGFRDELSAWGIGVDVATDSIQQVAVATITSITVAGKKIYNYMLRESPNYTANVSSMYGHGRVASESPATCTVCKARIDKATQPKTVLYAFIDVCVPCATKVANRR